MPMRALSTRRRELIVAIGFLNWTSLAIFDKLIVLIPAGMISILRTPMSRPVCF
jgi:hypothetical protein